MRRLAALAALAGAGACERVVALDLAQAPSRLVVEARLERVLGASGHPQVITLSTTAPYFSGSAPPPARGAVVRVTDDLGRVTAFAEGEPGRYGATLMVERGRRYTLRIDVAGERYEAVEATQTVPPIDSLYFMAPKPGRFSGTGGVRATIDLVDPAGVRNFYLWEQWVGGVRQLGPDSTVKLRVIAPDDALDGRPVKEFQPFEGIDIPLGSAVLVRQVALSEATYRYLYALNDQLGQGGSLFAVPPASVRGNVANRTAPDRPALGYFAVGEVAEARATRR